MTWILQKTEGAAGPVRFELVEPGPVFLGRQAGCQLVIDLSKVSRRHCVFRCADGRWSIEDLGSRNGTFVNQQRIHQVILRDGDELYVGGVQWKVCQLPGRDGPTPAESSGLQVNFIAEDTPTIQAAASVPDEPGILLARQYRLTTLLHQGSTGKFYCAIDEHAGQPVCVKVLSQEITRDEAQLQRFVRGVRAASGLSHPNIVKILGAGRSGPLWWMAMELMVGPSARRLAAEAGIGNMLTPARVYRIACDVLDALAAIHQRQLLHRNVRPDNILLDADDTAKLSNFSLARGVVADTLNRITITGELLDDLAYMAPERAAKDCDIDARSDLYALGACMYVLLTGRPPFTGVGTVDLLNRVRHEMPQPPSRINLAVPGALEGIVMKCLAKSPTDRFASARQLQQELARAGRLQGLWS